MPTQEKTTIPLQAFIELSTTVTVETAFGPVSVESPVAFVAKADEDVRQYRLILVPSHHQVSMSFDDVSEAAVILNDNDPRIPSAQVIQCAGALKDIAGHYATADGFAFIDKKLVAALQRSAPTKEFAAAVTRLFPKGPMAYALSADDFNDLANQVGALDVHPAVQAPRLDEENAPPAPTPSM